MAVRLAEELDKWLNDHEECRSRLERGWGITRAKDHPASQSDPEMAQLAFDLGHPQAHLWLDQMD